MSKFRLIDIFHRCATDRSNLRIILTPVGIIFFFGWIIFFIIVSLWVDKVLNLPAVLSAPLNIIFSIALLGFGIVLTLWSVIYFIRSRGTPVPFNPPPQLVKEGPYRYVRNPMLSGIFLIMFGIGFYLNSPSLLFIFTPLFILLNFLELKNVEEPELEKRFAEEYLEYKKRTPMFFPWI